ncbi:Protein ssh4 [Ceratocystis pirilliformis]|uniref:Protein SSH4 n=1 Tax=Ceratocystis pirilliformis TaxID=259994 RepID=A0ABR3ZAE2_9PEZI
MGSEPDNDVLSIILVGLLSSFISAIVIGVALIALYYLRMSAVESGRGWLDFLGRPGEFDDEQAFARAEEEALEAMDEIQRTEYLRAKAFVTANPPESVDSEISLSQYLAIQEKGVSAWEFEPELEIANCFVEQRTEIEFFDSECTVTTNLPVPKQNEVYYWEAKIFEKPENTLISIGMATKPYPLFRLPGFHKTSVAYLSPGTRRYNQPFNATPYGPQFVQGDVIGVGYRPRTGTIFFTRNGKKLDDVAHGLKNANFFPAIGANGPCTVHVNLGQSGYVFIEANVKKWGLAPATGSLAPPPPYGSEAGSILLESGKDGFTGPQYPHRGHSNSLSSYRVTALTNVLHPQHARSHSGTYSRILSPTSPGPQRSPTDISLAQLAPAEETGESSHHVPEGQTGGDTVGLGLQDDLNPPPDYTSPATSPTNSRRNSTDSENTPLIRVANRNRTASNASARHAPPIPSYHDAVKQHPRHDLPSSSIEPIPEASTESIATSTIDYTNSAQPAMISTIPSSSGNSAASSSRDNAAASEFTEFTSAPDVGHDSVQASAGIISPAPSR